MARLTKEEKLKSIEQKQADLEMQKKKLQAEINKEKRNARTKRLIEIGALVESCIGLEIDTENRRQILKNAFLNYTLNNATLGEHIKQLIINSEQDEPSFY